MTDQQQTMTDPVTVMVKGAFSFSLSDAFSKLLKQYPRGEQVFVVDLTSVDSLDVSAIGMLLQLREHSRGGNSLTVLNPGPAVRAMLAEGEAGKVLRIRNA